MSKSIKFTGSEDFRVLAAADLAKAGVEEGFSKTTFSRNEPKDIDEAAADAILGDPELFGQFEEASEEDAALFSKAEAVAAAQAGDTGSEAEVNVGEGTGRAGIKHSTKSSSRPR